MGMEVTGKIYSVFDTKEVSDRFRKREFVVELADNPKYPQLVMFQLTGDRCESLSNIGAGDEVRVEFSLRGREWKSPSGEIKYFNTLDAWKVERTAAIVKPTNVAPPPPQKPADPPQMPLVDDDIPF